MTELWSALLENPAYRHVPLNHLPITGLAPSACVLAWGLFEDRWAGVVFGLALVAATSLSGAPVLQSGDHAFLAKRFGRALLVNGRLSALAIDLGIRRIAWRRRLGVALRATSLASLGVAAVIAEAGGRIRHFERRTSSPPIDASAGRLC